MSFMAHFPTPKGREVGQLKKSKKALDILWMLC